jgi:hypothetical protein
MGALTFPAAGAEIMANITPTSDTFVVTRIGCEPGGNQPVGAAVFNNGYWIIDRYGSSVPLSLALTFSLPTGTVSYGDSLLPTNISLYNRGPFSTTAWTQTGFAGAASPAAANVVFPFVSSLGQFKIGSNGTSTLDIQHQEGLQPVTLYPNPANESIRIMGLDNVSENQFVSVFDATGRMVFHGSVAGLPGNGMLSVKEWANGIYRLVLTNGTQRQVTTLSVAGH